MIGKSLNERYGVRTLLPPDVAIARLSEVLAAQAKFIVRVRAQDPTMVACVVVRADAASVKMCRALGMEIVAGGTGVFGLSGPDAARAFPELDSERRVWLETPATARQTKVLLIASGIALLSLDTPPELGTVQITAV